MRALNEGMTKNSTRPVARIRDLHDLLGVIPHLLGFHPDESLVALVVVDGQVQLTARADLGDVAQSVGTLVAKTLGIFARANTE